MKLTCKIKLLADPTQAETLKQTMRAFNAACNMVAGVAFEKKLANKFELHKLVYRRIREEFGIPADMAVRVIAQVCEAYKRDKKIRPKFRHDASVPYSHGKNYSYKGVDRVSLQVCPSGRIVIPFVMGEYQAGQMGFAKGQADLVCRKGKWFLYVTVDVPESSRKDVESFLGIDLGIVNIATSSNGDQFTGEHVEKLRKSHHQARKSFQRTGTKSAKRRLKKMSGKQQRFQKDTNHRIAKQIVAEAKALECGIALEDLQGIRDRTEKTVRRKQRSKHSNWSFNHLRHCISYKAQLAGIPVVLVDPRNTSRTCRECGHCEKANRVSQERFLCRSCGFSTKADFNAASNIAARAKCQHASISSQAVPA